MSTGAIRLTKKTSTFNSKYQKQDVQGMFSNNSLSRHAWRCGQKKTNVYLERKENVTWEISGGNCLKKRGKLRVF